MVNNACGTRISFLVPVIPVLTVFTGDTSIENSRIYAILQYEFKYILLITQLLIAILLKTKTIKMYAKTVHC